MKKILFLIAMLFSSAVIAQTPNWTDVKETNISVANAYYFIDGVISLQTVTVIILSSKKVIF